MYTRGSSLLIYLVYLEINRLFLLLPLISEILNHPQLVKNITNLFDVQNFISMKLFLILILKLTPLIQENAKILNSIILQLVTLLPGI